MLALLTPALFKGHLQKSEGSKCLWEKNKAKTSVAEPGLGSEVTMLHQSGNSKGAKVFKW